jgi:hypothetical protein
MHQLTPTAARAGSLGFDVQYVHDLAFEGFLWTEAEQVKKGAIVGVVFEPVGAVSPLQYDQPSE